MAFADDHDDDDDEMDGLSGEWHISGREEEGRFLSPATHKKWGVSTTLKSRRFLLPSSSPFHLLHLSKSPLDIWNKDDEEEREKEDHEEGPLLSRLLLLRQNTLLWLDNHFWPTVGGRGEMVESKLASFKKKAEKEKEGDSDSRARFALGQ